MLISYNWLRELTGTTLTPLELRERLTMVGLAIDAVEEIEGGFVIDVEVPSNRPDCLSHIGIAREVAVIEKSKVQSPTSQKLKGWRPTLPKSKLRISISVRVMRLESCAAFKLVRHQRGSRNVSAKSVKGPSIMSPTLRTMCFTNLVSRFTLSIWLSSPTIES